jgi:hypothetical protein
MADYSGDLVEKHLRELNMKYFEVFFIWNMFKNSVFIYISAFFLSPFLCGHEKKLYLYRIWLESLKTFTNP